MDKRLWLAMALMILALVLSDVLFNTRRPPRAPAVSGAGDTVAVVPPLASAGERPPAPGGMEPPAAAAADTAATFVNRLLEPDEPDEILVAGNGYKAKLSRFGGVLTSFVVERYTDAKEQPVDLVRDHRGGALGMAILTNHAVLDLSRAEFHVEKRAVDGARRIEFVAEDTTGLRISKTYTFHPDSLTFRLSVDGRGIPNGDGTARYALGWGKGLPVLEVRQEYDKAAMACVALIGKDFVKDGGRGGRGCACSRGDGADRWLEDTHRGMVRWAGVRNKYFIGALIPHRPLDGWIVSRRNPGQAAARTSIQAPVDLDGRVREEFRVYVGPLKHEKLERLGVGLERAVDLGMKPIVPISKVILWSMTTLYKFIPNYGVVILIVSVLSKVLFYPLTKKSLNSMKRMQALKPELDRISRKFKDNPQRRNQETMKLYRKYKINPLGGCLPILVQMPIFFALYSVLYNVIELRKAEFVLWIKDLSIPDNVGYVMGVPINPLPYIMTGTMIVQQKLTPTDPRQATMAMVMPVAFLFFFYNLPSGLVFYWTVNNVVSIIQQLWMKRGDERASVEKHAERRDYAVASKR